jgi:hypothetical protein
MKRFSFGQKKSSSDSKRINARTLDEGLQIFKEVVIYPEKYVDDEYIEQAKYNNTLKRYEYVFNGVPEISIFEVLENNKLVFLKKVSLSSCLNDSIKDTISKKMIEYDRDVEKNGEENLPVIGTVSNLQSCEKSVLRQYDDNLMQQINNLEMQLSQMRAAQTALKSEMEKRAKIIYAMGTYLGLNEEIHKLKTGKTSSEDEPLSIFQQVLYIDEEIGIWANGGVDYHDLDKFDKWISENYDKFLYKEKSVAVFRVRRSQKDYGDIWANMTSWQENMKTYFLIRNGENLYRIWSDVYIENKVFPSPEELEVTEKDHSWDMKRKKHKFESYMHGFFALQGIIERTDIFGTNLRHIVNLPKNKFGEMINLIRDAESNYWITDGKLSWADFKKDNQNSITEGSRVLVIGTFKFFGDDSDLHRCYPYKPGNPPSKKEIFQIVEYKKVRQTFGPYLKIYYNPKDEIFNPNGYQYTQRKRNIPFWLYSDECLNFDNITVEDCLYYIHNRNERKNYLTLLPALHYILELKKQESSVEDHFCRLIQGRMSLKDDETSLIKEAIKWWKLKNKWKRDVFVDESKALRMIEGRISKLLT